MSEEDLDAYVDAWCDLMFHGTQPAWMDLAVAKDEDERDTGGEA